MTFDNNEKEIERLISKYGNDVLRISYMYLKDRDLAQDAFQEVFIKVFKNLDNFRHDSSEKTWISRITINVCKDMLKTNWFKNVSLIDKEELLNEEHENNVEIELSKKELFQQVLTLSDKYKDVIILYYYQGFDIKEIAVILDTTVGNVSSLLARARAQLKEIVR